MRLVAGARARRVHRERSVVLAQQDEAALGAQQLHGVVRNARGEATEVELPGQLGIHLEDAREPLFERRAGHAGDAGRTRRRQRTRRVGRGAQSIGLRAHVERRLVRRRVRDGNLHRGAQQTAARIVPVHLPEVARQARSDPLQRRQRLLTIATRQQRLAAGFLQLGARLQRPPHPFAFLAVAGRGQRFIQTRARQGLVARQQCDTCRRQQQQRSVRGGGTEILAGSLQLAPERYHVRIDPPRRDQHALEAHLGRVHAAPERVVRRSARFVFARRLLDVPEPPRELRPETGQLGPHHRRQLRALRVERLDAFPRTRQPPEIQVGVGEVQERIASRGAAPGATPHVDRRLEVFDGAGNVAPHLLQAGEVELQRGQETGFAGAFGGRDTALVGGASRFDPTGALQREAQGRERYGFDARRIPGLLDRALQYGDRLVVLSQEGQRETLVGQGLGAERSRLSDQRLEQLERPGVLAGANVGARENQSPGQRRVGAGLAFRQRLDAPQTLERGGRFAQAEIEPRAGDGQKQGIVRRRKRIERGSCVVEAPAVEEEQGALERIGGQRGGHARFVLGDHAFEVLVGRHRRGGETMHQTAQLARTAARVVQNALEQMVGERGNAAAHEIRSGMPLERRHLEPARVVAEPRARDGHDTRSGSAELEQRCDAGAVERIGVIHEHRQTGGVRVGTELRLDRSGVALQ